MTDDELKAQKEAMGRENDREKLRDACSERCADDAGDPPCYELDGYEAMDMLELACSTCRRACGMEDHEPLDPAAVVAPLL